MYSLRLRTLNSDGAPGTWSSVRTFIVDNTPPAPPVLSAPVDEAVMGTTRTPTFTWRAAVGAVSYVLEIASDASFDSVILSYHVATVSVTLPSALALPNGTYYWRVRASDAAGNLGAPSPARVVVIEAHV